MTDHLVPINSHPRFERHDVEQELRNLRAAVWAALRLQAQGRTYQAQTLLESCLPEGYEPVGNPDRPL